MKEISKNEEEPIRWDGQLFVNYMVHPYRTHITQEVVKLAVDAFNTYKSKFYRASIIFSAESICRVNFDLIRVLAIINESVEYKHKEFFLDQDEAGDYYNAIEKISNDLTYCDSINILKNQKVIDDPLSIDMHALRILRNCCLHSRLPRLDPYDDPRLKLSTEEIVELSLLKKDFPIKHYNKQFKIKNFGDEYRYIVDQERLNIDFRKMKTDESSDILLWGQEYSIISLGLMQLCMKQLVNCFQSN